MSDWPLVDLAEVSDISAGNPAPQGAHHFSDDGAPFVRMQDVGRTHINPALTETADRVSPLAIRECGLRLYPAGTLLIPKSGASVNLNHRAMLAIEAYVVSHLATIIPDQGKVLPSYLFHWSRLYDPRAQAQVTSLPSLPLSLIKTAKVPLPPLDEQRRIVALLDRAEAIRRRADTARQTARALIPALFTQTFGDPTTNPKGWEVVKLGDLISTITGGKNVAAGTGANPYQILKVSAVTSGQFRPEEAKPAPDGYQPPSDHHVRRGDFLFSRANTRELVGAVSIVEHEAVNLLLPDKLWRIEWKTPRIEPYFAYSLLRSAAVRQTFAIIASGTSDSMKNISQAKLRKVDVIIPPLPLQTAFAAQARRIEAMACTLDAATAKAEAIAAALSARLFGQASPSA